jgi:Phytanoyl-CoA dioxygenase (PhyH)
MGAPAFWRDGFAVLPSLLSGDEVEVARREVEAALRQPLPPGCERPHNTLAPLRWNQPLIELMLSARRRVEAVAEAVTADDLRWISGYVSLKEARSPALCWHQDWWCWDHPATFEPEPPQVAVLCYLEPTTAETGALRVLPGSHRQSTSLHAALREADALGDEIPLEHPAMSDQEEQVTVAVEAGDAVAIDYRLLHGTHPNRGGRRRSCLILNFVPSWRLLPHEIQAHLVRHPAQPMADERVGSGPALGLLPSFSGEPRDLPLNRVAPSEFAVR